MNFTYLLEGSIEPKQELLEKYEYFIVIVVLSEHTAKLVLENSGFELKSEKRALCWLVQPKHLKTAQKGSTLNRLYEFSKNKFPDIGVEHSFLVLASRDDLINNTGGSYFPLALNSLQSDNDRNESIRCTVKKALSALNTQQDTICDDSVLFAQFIASIIDIIKLLQ
ncbi:MAG: hypothetical protein QM520_00175 [Gammaproteobacteria bacterium]|nr:hypothetical protein [Gammaproteobacteria bacterium]